jgi:hypothetical protein
MPSHMYPCSLAGQQPGWAHLILQSTTIMVNARVPNVHTRESKTRVHTSSIDASAAYSRACGPPCPLRLAIAIPGPEGGPHARALHPDSLLMYHKPLAAKGPQHPLSPRHPNSVTSWFTARSLARARPVRTRPAVAPRCASGCSEGGTGVHPPGPDTNKSSRVAGGPTGPPTPLQLSLCPLHMCSKGPRAARSLHCPLGPPDPGPGALSRAAHAASSSRYPLLLSL